MKDTSALHPELQIKIEQLKILCSKNGFNIGIAECIRTVAEQDALYAKGRTTAGNIVTNAKGNTYSSMHQWGVAVDIYLDMDVDGDGKKNDDTYNNSKSYFDKIGRLGQSIGLEWGGSWKNIKDRPHFQLPNWGSTSTMLKRLYGTPDKFKSTWKKETVSNISTQNKNSTEKKESDFYMFEPPVLTGGMSGNAVVLWQTLLAGRGYDLGEDGRAGNVSGVFNGGTYIATLDYKKHVGISIGVDGKDGNVTAEVWKSIIAL